MNFKHLIVIGYSTIARDVLALVSGYAEKYNYSFEYIEHEIYPLSVASKFANANNIPHSVIQDKAPLTEYLLQQTASKTLIVSANNNYLFPKSLVEKQNITIINFHNALLPDFPGRNAASWAIYEDRKITGITWHYVTAEIDAGDIIIQKQCEIAADVKAYELLATQMNLAKEAFAESFEDILNGTVKTTRQNTSPDRKLYKSKDLPGNGMFSLNDEPIYIYRLLRAIDYGMNNIFPFAVTDLNGKKIRIRKYRKIKTADKKLADSKLFLELDGEFSLMLVYDVLCEDGVIMGGGIDLEYLYLLIAALKKANRRLVSNAFISENLLSKYIDEDKLKYSYLESKYLNIWYSEQNHLKLFYYIADIDCYRFTDIGATMVCEVYSMTSDAITEKVVRKLADFGFVSYACYHKWVRKKGDCDFENCYALKIFEGAANGFFDELLKHFDVYSDHIPTRENAVTYLKDKICYSVIGENNEVAGGLVISAKGNVQTEEFVFVNKNYIGKGIASALHAYWYKNSQHDNALRCEAWVRDDNCASSKLHLKFGYEKQKTQKITLVKGV